LAIHKSYAGRQPKARQSPSSYFWLETPESFTAEEIASLAHLLSPEQYAAEIEKATR